MNSSGRTAHGSSTRHIRPLRGRTIPLLPPWVSPTAIHVGPLRGPKVRGQRKLVVPTENVIIHQINLLARFVLDDEITLPHDQIMSGLNGRNVTLFSVSLDVSLGVGLCPAFQRLLVAEMKFLRMIGLLRAGLLGLLLINKTITGHAAIEIVPDQTTPTFFGNGKRLIRPLLHNTDNRPNIVNLRFQIYQASGSTLMPLGDARPWKKLSMAPSQSVLESLEIEIPTIRGVTKFRVIWFDGETKLGMTEIYAFPDGLLKTLQTLAGSQPIGVLDSENHLKAALGTTPMVELKEAEDIAITDAVLILVAPLADENRPAGLTSALKKRAATGGAIVWIQPVSSRQLQPLPDAYVVSEGNGKIVVASATIVADLANSPLSQLNLVRLSELATGKKQLELPQTP